MKLIALYVTALLFLAIVPAVSDGAETRQPAAAPAPSQSREQYEKTMQDRLGTVGKQLDELQVKAGRMAEQARKDINEQLEEVDKKEKAASNKLEELRDKSNEEWKKFTTDLNRAVDDLEKAFEKAKSRFKE